MGTANIASVRQRTGSRKWFIFFSTDYVFDGQGTETVAGSRTRKDLQTAKCIYGQTNLVGELAVSSTLDKYFIVRIAWVFA